MNYNNETTLLPNWPEFSRLWKIVAIVLFLLLLLLWLLQASPWSKNGGACAEKSAAPVDTSLGITDDNLPPVLSLNDNSVIHIPFGTSYSDSGAMAMDNIDGETSVVVTGEVDYNTPGEYVLTYTAVDNAGNKSSTTRTVIVDAKESVVMTESVAALPAAAKLYFGNASAALPADSSSAVADIIAYLKNDRASTAVISGYHSSTGSYEYNQRISKQRAESVSQLLMDAGISVQRVVLEKPVETTGSGSESEARRVEVSVR